MRGILVAWLVVAATHAGAQQPYGAYHSTYPYNGNVLPLDVSRAALGATPAELCAQRTDAELLAAFGPPVGAPLLFVGLLPTGRCGFQWLNLRDGPPGEVVTVPVITPVFASCETFAGFVPAYPRPGLCSLTCPENQKDPATGRCWVSTVDNGGHPCPGCPNPINPATGNKYHAETDIPVGANAQLGLARYYNSGLPAFTRALGGYWLHTYTRLVLTDAPATSAVAYRSDGKQSRFLLESGNWVGEADLKDTLTELKDANQRRTGWRYYVAATEETERYDAAGRLTVIESRSGLTQSLIYSDGTNGAVSGNGGFILDADGNPTAAVLPGGLLLRARDHFGRALTFGYNSLYRVVKITDAAGAALRYTYGANGNLVSVAYPDGTSRTYHYNEPAHTAGTSKPHALTGITDENSVRFATYRYDSVGRAIESVHHAGGLDVNRYQVAYGTPAVQTSVIGPLGTSRSFGFQAVLGNVKSTALDLPEAGPRLPAATAYDASGNLSSRKDYNGNRVEYSYDLARNLETSRTEGLTPAGGTTEQTRTITTAWHAIFRLPTQIAEPLRITTNVYDPDGSSLLWSQAVSR